MRARLAVLGAVVFVTCATSTGAQDQETHYPTPQSAAANLFFDHHAKPQVVHANVAGAYALIEVRGGQMEGTHNDDDVILLKHFAFGWQPLDSLRTSCGLTAFAELRADVRAKLHRAIRIPSPYDVEVCRSRVRDVGPQRDVEAVRAHSRQGFVPYVIVYGNFATAVWYGAGGGTGVFRRIDQQWTRIGGGGGQPDGEALRMTGVPVRDICRFEVPNCSLESQKR